MKKLLLLKIYYFFLFIIFSFFYFQTKCNAIAFCSFLFFIMFILLKKKHLYNSFKFSHKYILLLLAVYTTIAIPYASIIDIKLFSSNLLNILNTYIVFLLAILFSIYYIIYLIYTCTYNIEDTKVNYKNIVFIISVIVSIISVFSFISYTGYPDTEVMVDFCEKNIWSNWHTLAFELYMCLFIKNGYTIVIISVFQAIIFTILTKYVLDSLNNNKLILLYGILSLIMHQPYFYVHFVVKDVIFSYCMLGFVVSTYNLIIKNKNTYKDFLIFLLCGIGLSNFRHLAITTTLLTSALLVLYFLKYKDKKKVLYITFSFIIFILSFVFINIFLSNKLNANKNPDYIKYTTPIYMISSFISEDISYINNNDLNVINEYTNVKTIRKCFDKYWADSVSRTYACIGNDITKVDNKIGNKILFINYKLFMKHPIKYINKLSDIDSILYKITIPNNGTNWALIKYHSVDYDFILDYYYKSPLFIIFDSLNNFLGNLPIYGDLLWMGGIYLLLFLIILIYLIINKLFKYIIVITPLLFNHLLLFISVPSQDPRYVLPLMITLPFIICIWLQLKSRYQK